VYDQGLGIDIETLLWRLVYQFRHIKNQTSEDLLSEARLTAIIAIGNFKKEKQTKLTSYVYQCVKNRLMDLYRSESLRHSVIEYRDEVPDEECVVEDLEFALLMRSLLTERENALFQKHYVEGFTKKELVASGFMKAKEIYACSARISLKYLAIEENRQKILTKTWQQDSWLRNSDS